MKEATWECENTMSANYPFLFEEGGMFLAMDIKWSLHMHVIVYVHVCVNFRDEILSRGEECKT